MNRKEANEVITLINTFVDDYDENVSSETEALKEPKVELTKEELKKLFRNKVPEGFSFDKADLVRNSTTGDKVWLRFNETKRWIPDLPTLEKMGYGLSDVKEISDEDIKGLKEEQSIFPKRIW